MAWTLLIIAGMLEVGWAAGMKHSQGWTRLWPSVMTIALMVASMYLLTVAVKTIPVGTGYAVWTGIGAVGTAIYGMVRLGESASPGRIACIGLIVVGIVGLKLAGK